MKSSSKGYRYVFILANQHFVLAVCFADGLLVKRSRKPNAASQRLVFFGAVYIIPRLAHKRYIYMNFVAAILELLGRTLLRLCQNFPFH